MTWNKIYDDILSKYAKPIVHMRAQHQNGRLSLMLGSGVSKPLGVPNWEELVKRIAESVHGEGLIASQEGRSSITSRIQLLFERFQESECPSGDTNQGSQDQMSPFIDSRIKKQWYELVRTELYKAVELKHSDTINSYHPYLGAYVDVIRKSPMTVNYNFDDFIEKMLSEFNQQNGKSLTEGYESVWDINLQFKSNSAIIYHPNGYLPSDPLEKRSDWLVFSEDEYADQLIYSMTGYFSSLAHHLSKNTCVLMGLSLEDSTLRHLLRQSSRINPGHYHYYIAYVKDDQYPVSEEIAAISSANFEVYNLITLFLTDKEIKALGDLIALEDGNFRYSANGKGHRIKYCFYVSGALGAGKSTVVSYFRSLQTHDEWTERRPPILAKYVGDLTEKEEEEADGWLVNQFDHKNWDLWDAKDGIHIVDRPPLDPLGFTEEAQWPEKASYLLETVCRSAPKVEPGRVILLVNDPNILITRIKPPQRGYTFEHLEKQQERLREVYKLASGVTVLNSTGLTINDVVKMIARIIHMQKYEPCAQLHERLEEIKKGGKDAQ